MLVELVRFALARGEDITRLVAEFGKQRPDLLDPPPPGKDSATDAEVSKLIEDGAEL